MPSNNILKSTLAIAFAAAFAVAVQAQEKPSGAEGVLLSVKDDVDLATVKKGDMVKADFVESFAVDVTEN